MQVQNNMISCKNQRAEMGARGERKVSMQSIHFFKACFHFSNNFFLFYCRLWACFFYLASLHCIHWQESKCNFFELSTSAAPSAAFAYLTATSLLALWATGKPQGWQKGG